MIRPPLQDVELPLMNHFVGQGVHDLLLGIVASLGDCWIKGTERRISRLVAGEDHPDPAVAAGLDD